MSDDATASPIRVRTKAERMAYLHGYACAINDIRDKGLEAAASHLGLVLSLEDDLPDEDGG